MKYIDALTEIQYQEAMRAKGIDYQVNNLVVAKIEEALEKQIPKKPLPYKGFDGKCACCGVIFLDPSTNYCGNCGQALDWMNN